MKSENGPGLEYALALTAALLATMGRRRRRRVLANLEQWLGEPDGSGRHEAHEALRANLVRFLAE